MAGKVANGRYLATQGARMAMHDDQETYKDGLISFLRGME